MNIVEPVMMLGDTVTLNVTINSKMQGEARLALVLHPALKLVGTGLNDYVMIDSLTVDTNQNYLVSYQLVVESLVDCHLSFGARANSGDLIDEWGTGALDFVPNGPVLLPKMPCWQTRLPNEDRACDNFIKLDLSCQNINNPDIKKNIKINGKIVYDEWAEEFAAPKIKGAFNDVWLYFVNKNELRGIDEMGHLYHPVPSSIGIEKVHYAKCNSDGSFEFDFNFCLDSLICPFPTANWEIWLFPSKENAGTRVISITDHFKIFDPYRLYNKSIDTFFTRTYPQIIKVEFNPNLTFTPINLNPHFIDIDDGAVLRHSEIARRFIKERIGDIAYNEDGIKQTTVSITTSTSNPAEYFFSSENIKVRTKIGNNRSASKTNIYHEYGHYIDGRFNRNNWDQSAIRDEGWAIFFSFATKAFASNEPYNELIDFDVFDRTVYVRDNLEMGPYNSRLFDFDDDDITYGNWPRFGNIDKIRLETTDGAEMCRYACYLWNIYDTFNDGIFQQHAYLGKDNDDLQGYSQRIFKYSRDLRIDETKKNYLPADIHTDLINSSTFDLNDFEKSSFNSLFNFLDFGLPWTTPIPTNKNMKSPSLNPITHYKEGNNLIINWGDSRAPNPTKIGFDVPGFVIEINKKMEGFTWRENFNFKNKELGVRIYKLGQGYELVQTVASDIKTATVPYVPNRLYIVCTYNELGGDSYPYEFINCPPAKNSNEITKSTTIEIKSYPNPVKNNLNLYINLPVDSQIEAMLYDIKGVELYSEIKNYSSGEQIIVLDMSHLLSGNYYLILKIIDNFDNIDYQSFILNKN